MQCCVPFCEITSETVSISNTKGITFHGFPSEVSLHTAWLEALGMRDTPQPDPGVVCSQHFLDDDFYTTGGVRQIRSDAVPSTLKICLLCLDTDSKLVPMDRHKLEETYELLTGLRSWNSGNLRRALCVTCAQRLLGFSRFRDTSLRACSLLTELLEKHPIITIQHLEHFKMANHSKQYKCNLESTTPDPDHSELYTYHTDEQKELKPSVDIKIESDDGVTPVDESIAVKIEVPEECSDRSMIEVKQEEFVQADEYNEHMSTRMQDTDSDDGFESSFVCEPREHMSWDSANLGNKQGIQRRDAVSLTPPHSPHTRPPLQTAETNKTEQIYEVMIDNTNKHTHDNKIYINLNNITNCVTIYNTNKQPKRYILEENASQVYSCDICPYKSVHKNYLNKHRKIHTVTDKPYSCEKCSYKCAQKSDLGKHIKIHSGDKPFSCKNCDYKCIYESYLNKHMRIHTGEKPHSCNTCSYKCARKSDLRKHMKIHTGEKPFSCDLCEYKCARRGYLIQHMKTHTNEMPHACTMCDYRTGIRANLIIHIRTHTGEKPYLCEQCDYRSACRGNLKIHMKVHAK